MDKWTQDKMQRVAEEERAALGVGDFEPFDPYDLAKEYGISVYSLADLAGDPRAAAAVAHFSQDGARLWSAALIPVGDRRIILENDTHLVVRRRSSIGHELGHHLLEHPFETLALSDDKCRRFDAAREKQATFFSGHLLISEVAAKRAAFDGWSNEQVGDHFQVSVQFAQMRMRGVRVMARHALARQAQARSAGRG